MKLQSVIAAIGLVMAIALPSCSHADTPQKPVETSETSRLGQILASTIEQSDKTGDDFYILYNAATDSFQTMTADEYELAHAYEVR